MFTIRQVERLLRAGDYARIISICMQMRIEDSVCLRMKLGGSDMAAAALAVIRLDELNQSYLPISSALIRTILGTQQADGGWGDPLLTALCLRALMCGNGAGAAIDRAIGYLAALQKSEGTWPKVGFRRMPADAFVSAFVLFSVGEDERFRRAVRFEEATRWFEANEQSLDADTKRLWRIVAARRQIRPARETSFSLL